MLSPKKSKNRKIKPENVQNHPTRSSDTSWNPSSLSPLITLNACPELNPNFFLSISLPGFFPPSGTSLWSFLRVARGDLLFFSLPGVVIFLFYFDLSAVFVRFFFPADDAGIRLSQLTVPYRWLFTRSTIWWCFVIFQRSFRTPRFFLLCIFITNPSLGLSFGATDVSFQLSWYYRWKNDYWIYAGDDLVLDVHLNDFHEYMKKYLLLRSHRWYTNVWKTVGKICWWKRD